MQGIVKGTIHWFLRVAKLQHEQFGDVGPFTDSSQTKEQAVKYLHICFRDDAGPWPPSQTSGSRRPTSWTKSEPLAVLFAMTMI